MHDNQDAVLLHLATALWTNLRSSLSSWGNSTSSQKSGIFGSLTTNNPFTATILVLVLYSNFKMIGVSSPNFWIIESGFISLSLVL